MRIAAPPPPALAPLGRGLGREQAASLEQAQYPLSHGVLYSRNVLLAERCRFAKPHTFGWGAKRHSRRSAAEVADQYRDGCFKHPIDNRAVEMQVGIEIYGIPRPASQRFMNRITVTASTR